MTGKNESTNGQQSIFFNLKKKCHAVEVFLKKSSKLKRIETVRGGWSDLF